MRTQLEALWRNQISFEKFARETRKDWDRLANYVFSHWQHKVPAGVTLEDVRQELLIQAWVDLVAYDPELCPDIQQFIVFRSCATATRWLNKQRNSLRRDNNAESRCPAAFSVLGEVTDDLLDLLALQHQPGEDRWDLDALLDAKTEFAIRLEAALEKAGGPDVWSLAAVKLAKGDLCEAGKMLFDDLSVRKAHQWLTPAEAAETAAEVLCAWFTDERVAA